MKRELNRAVCDKNKMALKSLLNNTYKLCDGIYSSLDRDNTNVEQGYWSNISEQSQDDFLLDCNTLGTINSVRKSFPLLEDIIFEPTRSVGLKLLDIKHDHVGIDYGCMWGNLLIHSAKKCNFMVGIDQTMASLNFLKQRLIEEKLDNVALIHDNLRNRLPLDETFDFAIINGVLEWIPDTNQIDLTKFFKRSKTNSPQNEKSPKELQLEFLKKVHTNLRNSGKLFLAIENRWDYQYFLWKRDPHSSLFYTAILPRQIANFISKIYYNRSYVNYIYSIKELENLLITAGFNVTDKYAVFPDYRLPQRIIDFKTRDTANYRSIYSTIPTKNIFKRGFRKGRSLLDNVLYKKMKLLNLAPSFIVIAQK